MSQGTPLSSSEIVSTLRSRVKALEHIINKQQFIEDRYEELMLTARRALRYNGVDAVMFEANLKAMDFLIRRHQSEIDEMEEKE